MYQGIGASAGIGIGRVMLVTEKSLDYTPVRVKNISDEVARYKNALKEFCAETQVKADKIAQSLGEKEAEILQGHILMIQDPYMNGEIEKLITGGECAEKAVETICDMFIDMFSAADDELTKQRATDVADIKKSIVSILLGVQQVDISTAPPNTIIVVGDLTPSMTAGINRDNIVGIVTQVGGKASHSAILARALEIPAVLSVPCATQKLTDGMSVIVDGTSGEVIPQPKIEQVEEYTRRKLSYLAEKKALERYIGMPTVTADNIKVELVGNIGKPQDAPRILECDGEGVGLFRTEFLFMDNAEMPTEDEQFDAYKRVALTMKDKPVIIRTLDIGGDKEIPYMGLDKEDNPFLGFRAVRFCLQRSDIYKIQLRALLRASAFGNVKIMIPLVTCVEEVRAVKALVAECKAELDAENRKYNSNVQVGVMMETSAATMIADLLAKEADFFSIGTNDLTGYTMAVDRGNPRVAYLYSAFNPAVLRSIQHIIKCGLEQNIMVGMCGEAAADPMLIPLLISFGLSEYSVSATAVLATRKQISRWSKQQADEIANKALSMTTEAEVVAYLKTVVD
ncbi:MAG TPA: phosphoenolpyruvate--protein phosphotransferase [Clostridiales bacterium]|nr:phosphoenolpyruvate--protein phosphotransferase [Clostridiales bacterium]